jgi:hypothetical protein
MSSRASPIISVVCNEYMSEFLVWPDMTQHKSKRQIRRQRFAITSGKYQEVVDRHISKAAEERGKEV